VVFLAEKRSAFLQLLSKNSRNHGDVMSLWQKRSRRAASGKYLHHARKKKKRELGGEFAETKMGPLRKASGRTFGGNSKMKLLRDSHVNVATKEGIKRVAFSSVLENEASRHFVRRNIITKGAIVQTELGKARITSRPGQDGVLNAVLIE
jgi:small subunit ribosomal protein S8e